MAAQPGTIPSLPVYKPGGLTITGQEIVEIASSQNATSAASYQMLITDLVGKAPSVMSGANPVSSDLVAFYQVATNLPKVLSIGNIGVAVGNLPSGGGTSQLLNKNSGTNFDTSWISIASLVSVGIGGALFTTGASTSITIGVAGGGITSPLLAVGAVLATSIATNAVGNAQLRQSAGLSVVGVTGTTTVNVADITGVASQVLAVNSAGTGLVFTGQPTLSSSILLAHNVTAVAGGTTTGVAFFASNAATAMGVYFGSGAPTVVGATGSLYMNIAPTNATSRIYVNTNGSTTWAGLTATA
jgi:hypothetical protein